jgi:endonuclease YncB( thermonuclease family)
VVVGMPLFGLALATGTGSAQAQDAIPADAVEAAFLLAPDGEKMKVRIGTDFATVRLIGVDAPEPSAGNNETECYAAESTDLLTTLLTDQTVYLEADAEDKDNKDRLWRYVWAYVDGAPTLINEYLLAQGAGIAQTEEKNTRYQQRLADAQAAAKAAGLGLWGQCGGDGHKKIARHGGKDDPGQFGETLNAEGLFVTTSDAFVTYDYNFSTPKGGYKFVIFNATIENRGSDKRDYSSSRFEARDLDTDAKHKETFVLLDQPLGNGDLSSGSYVSGQVALEVQESSTNLLVQYQLASFGEVFLYWQLTL